METSEQPNSQRILSTLQAYRDAAALNTAVELDLFTRIAHGVDTPSKIAAELSIPVRGVRLVCDYLAAAGLLQKEDEQLKLAPDAAAFLVKQSPQYLGTDLRVLYSPALLRGFENLTAAVRAGVAQDLPPAENKQRPEWYDMARGVMPDAAAGAFAAAVGLPSEQPLKILEVGAGNGRFGIALATRYPAAVIVALDSPAALSTAQEKAEASKLGTRFQNIPGDPLTAPFGLDYDAVVLACNLHQFNISDITSLFMRIHYALKKTGRLVILEFLSEDSPEYLCRYSGFRLNVLAATPRGDAYSFAEVKEMLESSGFHSIDANPVPAAAATLITAKP